MGRPSKLVETQRRPQFAPPTLDVAAVEIPLGGQVKVEFAVMPDGSVTSVRVAVPSKSSKLDELAVATMRNLRLPPPPPGLPNDQRIYDMVFFFN